MADLSVCGVLPVCLNVIYGIKNGSPFSFLENAMVANKNNRRFFNNFVSILFMCFSFYFYYILFIKVQYLYIIKSLCVFIRMIETHEKNKVTLL